MDRRLAQLSFPAIYAGHSQQQQASYPNLTTPSVSVVQNQELLNQQLRFLLGSSATSAQDNNRVGVSPTQVLPPIPSSVISRIRRGEFVNFDNLLPQNLGRPTSSAVSLSFDGDTLSLSNPLDTFSQSINNNSNHKKARILDLCSWMLAWTLFIQAMVVFHGHLTQQLHEYQLFIAKLASQYNFNAWYSYDQAFRQHIANNPQASWAVSNVFLYNLHANLAHQNATSVLLLTIMLLGVLRVDQLALCD